MTVSPGSTGRPDLKETNAQTREQLKNNLKKILGKWKRIQIPKIGAGEMAPDVLGSIPTIYRVPHNHLKL